MNDVVIPVTDPDSLLAELRRLRAEIAQLHEQAKTQEECVTLLEAHHNLVAVAEHCFTPEKCVEIRRIARAEYLNFLNTEALEGGNINPVMLDRITAREVEAGRLDPDDDFRKFAEAGGAVLGDTSDLRYDRKLGDSIGIAGLIIGVLAFFLISKGAGIVIFVAGMIAGWIINDQRKKRAIENAQLGRAARGYDRA
jgi:hypothetical protein